ncbi:MAG: 6,7-dimethyl-8-ribityllumazine synthase [Bacteroidales bacterium]|nr:6,7-dimethyl-8-ribityllumazine synthase [Bacteroidales bacterium]
MATKYQNLSEYNSETMPQKEVVAKQSYAIVVADWNPEITMAMLDGAYNTLIKNGAIEKNIHVLHVPGTLELTFATSQLVTKKKIVSGKKVNKYDAIIVIGCVIQGETPHFTYVCEGVTQGITALNLRTDGSPIIFGVLTTNTLQQAKDRAGGINGNKGNEAAIGAIKMANIVW